MRENERQGNWLHGYDWQSVRSWILEKSHLNNEQVLHLESIAHEIARLFLEMADEMEQISQLTCPQCSDICCLRATVWYDIKDLLYIYYYSKELPRSQIWRRPDGACCYLGEYGCSLERSLRPFICTWYICPAQKDVLHSGLFIHKHLEKIKQLREELLAVHGSSLEDYSPIA